VVEVGTAAGLLEVGMEVVKVVGVAAGTAEIIRRLSLYRLTSRAQARGADDVVRDSGTGLSSIAPATEEAAIPRWLQRFVRQLHCDSLAFP
jgi:hypothetical protein